MDMVRNQRVRIFPQNFSLQQFLSGVPAIFFNCLCVRESPSGSKGVICITPPTLFLELFRGPGYQNLGWMVGHWRVVKNLTSKSTRRANIKLKKCMPVQKRIQINPSVGNPVRVKLFFLKNSLNYSYSVHTKLIFVSMQADVPIEAMHPAWRVWHHYDNQLPFFLVNVIIKSSMK